MVKQLLTLAPGAPSVCPCTHQWSRLPDAIGLFACTQCVAPAVCPGCLNSLFVALNAAKAGFTVIWCEDHNTGVPGSAMGQLG